MRVRRLETFVSDLTEAYTYLAQRSPASADRLFDSIELLSDLLARFPKSGRSRPRLGKGVRSFRVRGFPYVALYRIEPSEVVLLRLWHGARRLGRKTISG
ncbi:MAG: type II toxin-antitoxin system RelE/ParE family toxin [Phycisphaerales bacterium]|nr:type II toxin-antitoxin system RelE/ParE family toxin [Hyphomonadaceae bacterium]